MSEQLLKQIEQAIKNIKYGSVEIVIHDSQVVQIERKEKLRLSQKDKQTRADRTSGSFQNNKGE